MPKVFIIGEDQDPKAKFGFDLNQLEIKIGKTEENHIIIADCDSVSSHHCSIYRVLGGFVIKDLDSTNGITIDGEKVKKAELVAASSVHVGDTEIRFSLSKEEIANLGKEPANSKFYVSPELVPEIEALHHDIIESISLDKRTSKTKGSENAEEIIDLSSPSKPSPPPPTISKASGAPTMARVSGLPSNSGNSYRPPVINRSRSRANTTNPLALFILAIMGFLIGLALFHKNEYGTNLFSDFSENKVTLKLPQK